MPKIIGNTLNDHRELTRLRLFDALGALLAEQGFDTITMSQIAKRANVGRTAVYNHFADKEVLLLAFMAQATSEFSRHLRTALEGMDDPVEQLRIYVRSHLDITERYHLASGINLRQQISATNSEHLGEHADVVGTILREILENAMTGGHIPVQDPTLLANLIHSTLAGQRLPTNLNEREMHITGVLAYIMRGVGVSSDKLPELPAATVLRSERNASTLRHASSFMRCPVHTH